LDGNLKRLHGPRQGQADVFFIVNDQYARFFHELAPAVVGRIWIDSIYLEVDASTLPFFVSP
jgi:hypothetical protein